MKESKADAILGLPSKSPVKPIKSLSPLIRTFYSDVDQTFEGTRNDDMSRGSAICANYTITEPSGYYPKPSHASSKGMKPLSALKGKKSIAQFGPKMSKQRSLPEWKLVQSKESKITKQKTNRERFSFSRSSLEFREFKVGGSSKLEVAGLDHIPNQASLDTKKVAVGFHEHEHGSWLWLKGT